MEIVKNEELSYQPQVREMNRWEILISNISRWWLWNITRKLPTLVWYGDDVDICVTFTDLRLAPESKGVTQPDGSVRWDIRYEGDMESIWRAEQALYQLGLSFDTGTGCGRDWEWDYSLRGPVRISFKKRHKGDRKAKAPRPALRIISSTRDTEK